MEPCLVRTRGVERSTTYCTYCKYQGLWCGRTIESELQPSAGRVETPEAARYKVHSLTSGSDGWGWGGEWGPVISDRLRLVWVVGRYLYTLHSSMYV